MHSANAQVDKTQSMYCIDALLASVEAADDHAHRTRLALTVISILPSLRRDQLPHVLDELLRLAKATEPPDLSDLASAIYTEITERVGDNTREMLISWWLNNSDHFRKQSEQ